jgi:hypothetical protein
MKPRIAARTVYAVPVRKLTPTANAEKCREPWSRAVAMTRIIRLGAPSRKSASVMTLGRQTSVCRFQQQQRRS